MKIEPKISGWRVTEYEIDTSALPFKTAPFIKLSECMELSQESMNYLLDNFRFEKGDFDWWAILGTDDTYKIAILEMYPEYKKELEDYFGEKWLAYYLRFNH